MNKEEYHEAIYQAKKRIELLENAMYGNSQYKVPITYENYHNGNIEHSFNTVWARNEKAAIFNACTTRNGINYASLDGAVEKIRDVPVFNEKMELVG